MIHAGTTRLVVPRKVITKATRLHLAAFSLFKLATGDWFGAITFGSFVVLIYIDELYWSPMRRKRAAAIVANGG